MMSFFRFRTHRCTFRVVTQHIEEGLNWVGHVALDTPDVEAAYLQLCEDSARPLTLHTALEVEQGGRRLTLRSYDNPRADELREAIYGPDWRGYRMGSLGTGSILKDLCELAQMWEDEGADVQTIIERGRATAGSPSYNSLVGMVVDG